jgi:hypothetical protein
VTSEFGPIDMALGVIGAPGVGWWQITPADRVRPTGETYLRLGNVDLDDPAAILRFVNQYGLLGGAAAYASLQSLGGFFKQHYKDRLDPRHERAKKRRALRAELTRIGHPLAEFADDEDDSWWDDHLPLGEVPLAVETLEEFRFAARCIRDLQSAWLMFRDGRNASDFKWVSSSRPELFATILQPAMLLGSVLRVFLRDFTPHIRLPLSYEGPAPMKDALKPTNPTTVEPQRDPDHVPLHAVCTLELFNHIVDNAEYHECANERCGQTFVHQQGRSEKGQHRSRGVMYCSLSCARATAQREYRRRRRRSSG